MECPDCVAAMRDAEKQKGKDRAQGWHRDGH
jgi:hypothetical protein